MRSETFPKAGSVLDQQEFPVFGIVYLSLSALVQFVWGGLKAAKVILMVDELQFTENQALIILHLQASLMDMSMCIGNVLGNLYCGPYITCLTQEVLKALITCPICTLATMGMMKLEERRKLYLYGQAMGVLTAFGNSCLSAFLADQFNAENYYKFNKLQIIMTLASTALGIFTVPHLIQYYQCFWTNTCYSFVWLIEWALCVITVVVFVFFFKSVNRSKPKFSTTYMVIVLARDAFRKRRRESHLGKQTNKPLLQYSEMFSSDFRKEAQKMWSMWTFYFPLAGYWALHSQQSTTWILQAKRLNGNLFNWSTVLPNELWGVVPLTAIALRMMLLTFVDDTKYPLRMTVFSQMIMTIAFMFAAILEKYIMDGGDLEVHMAWALPQLLLVSFSDTILISSYRKFVIRQVSPRFRGVAQNFFFLARSFGNAIVVIINVMEMETGFPNRMGQFIIYATVLNFFLIIFTVVNRKFERLFKADRKSTPGTSTANR